jgi:hypothetical protein
MSIHFFLWFSGSQAPETVSFNLVYIPKVFVQNVIVVPRSSDERRKFCEWRNWTCLSRLNLLWFVTLSFSSPIQPCCCQHIAGWCFCSTFRVSSWPERSGGRKERKSCMLRETKDNCSSAHRGVESEPDVPRIVSMIWIHEYQYGVWRPCSEAHVTQCLALWTQVLR